MSEIFNQFNLPEKDLKSILPPNKIEKKVQDGKPVTRGEVLAAADNSEWYKLVDSEYSNRPMPRNQMFLTRLFKGVLPFADIVFFQEATNKNGDFFSLKQNNQKENPSMVAINDGKVNDLFLSSNVILKYIFSDSDHFLDKEDLYNLWKNVSLGGSVEDSYMFDFGRFGNDFWKYRFNSDFDKFEEFSQELINDLINKIDWIISKFSTIEIGFVIDILLSIKKETGKLPEVILEAPIRHEEEVGLLDSDFYTDKKVFFPDNLTKIERLRIRSFISKVLERATNLRENLDFIRQNKQIF